MTESKDKYDFITLDKRVIESHLRRHHLSQKEYDKYLKGLKDEAEASEEAPVFQESPEDRDS